ncbi:type II toxin-antitoxin system death-on-curing family toxin [Mycoplasmopsis phocirhinis]|nr:type II toxin-antitoxin system death-on-curing family toxin [Mycoplasmopsis phocirhinis]
MLKICFYEEINDIFDFVGNLFIFTLQSHKLKNGNKRFSFMFLNTLLRIMGFYLKWTNKSIFIEADIFNYYQQYNEYLIYSFVTKLQNRDFGNYNINEFMSSSASDPFLSRCYKEIAINYSNQTIEERHARVKNEIKIWLKSNLVIKLNY